MKIDKFYAFVGMGALALASANIAYENSINDPIRAKKILEQKGFTNIRIGSTHWWCTRKTPIKRNFEATKNGEALEGSICADRLLFPDNISVNKIKPKM